MNMIEVRWHGRGGQGSFTAARLLGLATSVYGGKYSQAFPSFGPERRGAPVLGFTRISDFKITDRSELDTCNYVVVLDETLWGTDISQGLKSDSVIIINTKTPEKYQSETSYSVVGIDATQLALDHLNLPITNTAMMGALVAISGMVNTDHCKDAIRDSMNPKIAAKNVTLFESAYQLVKESYHRE
jgi:pyruvate ferredoxin oxidoreductase gamma subunit